MPDFTERHSPEELIDALFKARRENRRDLQHHFEPLLDHEEPIVRAEALSLLAGKWKIAELREKLVDIMFHDPDRGVRTAALLGLAAVSTAATRAEDASLLARCYADRNSDGMEKRASFEALSLMAGRPTYIELDETSQREVDDLVREVSRTTG
jgi:hypothetical protein